MQTRTLPLFPLPLVLFPGASEALHVFEPRYRQLLADCQSGDGQFGISPVTDASGATPAVGSVGCTAVIGSVVPLPDGRSNIIVTGGERYAIADYVESDRPYLVAEVVPIEDEHEWDDQAVEAAAAQLHRQLDAYRDIVRRLPELPDPPAPPDDPGLLSFIVAAVLPLDLATKIALLELRSTPHRLLALRSLLDDITTQMAARATIQRRAKRNGRRPLAPGGTT